MRVDNGGAEEIERVLVDCLEAWNIKDNVKAASFDTTSVNSGHIAGAAVLIAKALGKDLIWLPCRHHVFERVLESVFHEVMGPSTGPDSRFFKILSAQWDNLDKTKYVKFNDYAESRTGLQNSADSIIQMAEKQLEVFQPRNDYQELLHLTITFLGGVPPSGVRFKRPGAMSSARWMAKALYCLKLCLFRRQLGSFLTQAETNGLLRVAVFIVKLFVKVWFEAPDPLAAPRNDLQFLKDLQEYEKVNKKVALAAQKRFVYHSWYLTEINVAFSLFDEQLSFEVRDSMVQKILEGQITEAEPSKKRNIDLKNVAKLELLDLVTGNTLRFFKTLGLETSFFQYPSVFWSESESYKQCKEIVSNLRVVNDTAERAVKLMKDYNQKSTKNEDNFQNMLLGIQDLRQSLPEKEKTKALLVKKYDKK